MRVLKYSLLLLGFVALSGAGCRRHNSSGPAAPALPAVAVRAQTVEPKPHVATEETVGTVRARLRARIESKVAGRILEMRAEPGGVVKAGDLLARLDVQEIRARLDQALATQQQAAGDLKRFSALLERDAVTQAEFDAVQMRARVADAAVKEAQTMLSYADVVAPFDGVVTRKLADIGDLAAPGKPLVEMEDPLHLRLETDIPEALIGRVKPGAVMSVRVSGVGELAGTVSEIAPSADPNSRTFAVKLDLPPAEGLRAGQFGRVAVPVSETTALRVPVSAVVQRGQLQMVFVVADNRAVMRLVKTGRRVGGEVEIASGLSPGESVVIENADSIVDGQPVEIRS
ncbi:MAG TPA: efflux RND transporter periplasmic adaptor subunit [Verrucomicrobiota bacterium]|nr:efflux RND transporter periplasmic adaptor subunit [Verrucomicrobiota bacterium]